VGAPRGGSRISGWEDNEGAERPERGTVDRAPRGWNKKLVHLALGLFMLGALFQNNLGC